MSVFIASEPEIVDLYPHGAKKFDGPLALRIGHGDAIAGTVLLLEIAPFLGEFAAEEVFQPIAFCCLSRRW